MKNTKGFLLYEMIIGISLSLLIAVFLFNMIISISSNTTKMSISTEVYKQEALILKMINDDIHTNSLIDIVYNSENNYTLKYKNTKDKDLIINVEENTVQYDDYKKVLPDSVKILSNITFNKTTTPDIDDTKNDTILSLSFKIGNKNIELERVVLILGQVNY